MKRCSNIAASKIGLNKLDGKTEVTFTVLNDVDSCRTINTKKYLTHTGTSAVYDVFDVPEDVLNCDGPNFINTGTLLITSESEIPVEASFSLATEATDFAAGVITYYVKLPETGLYTTRMAISDITCDTQTDADMYIKNIKAENAGFYPVVIDLSKLPDLVNGKGWTPSELGVMIGIIIESEGTTVKGTYGISSISIFESIEDLEANDVVIVGCIDDFTGDITVDPTDATCFGSQYNASSVTVERSLTARSVTPNYWKLNPLMNRGEKVDGWQLATEEKEIQTTTIDGITYGYILVSDMYVEECAFAYAAINGNGKTTESTLQKVNSPVTIELNLKQFMVMGNKFLFHPFMAGKSVTISYPKKADAEHFVANTEKLTQKRVKMSFTVEQSDGVIQQYVYNNVLITSFPMSLTLEETTFAFTINVQRDKNGSFFEMFRIVNI